jgi:multiple sugar transport system permease protein
MLLKTFIDGIGPEIEEQAWIDGCTRSQGFVRILLPLLAPGIIAAVIFVCVFAWNDFVFAFLLTGTRTKTAPVMISELLGGIGEGVTEWNTVFAAATIQIVPILVFIWLIQKRLVSGFTLGSVKG